MSGSLYRLPGPELSAWERDRVPSLVASALRFCDKPYSLEPVGQSSALGTSPRKLAGVSRWHRRLVLIGNKRFWLSTLYAGMHRGVFGDSVEAAAAAAAIPEQRSRRLCLQRALLIAKSSKSFPATGVVFVGAKLPTMQMHAWVIDDGQQPDCFDRDWINYRPLLALVDRKNKWR